MEHNDNDFSTTRLQGWLERLRAGDTSARDELLRHCAKRLEELTRKKLRGFSIVKAHEETDDVYQKAVMRLLRSLERVELASVRDFFGLASAHIRRELIDLHRHYSAKHNRGISHNPVPTDDDSGPSLPEHGCTTDEAGKLAEWAELHQMAAQLPEEEREVFDLLWYQDLTQAEAAVVLEVSERTVLRRWMAARLRLREYLRDE